MVRHRLSLPKLPYVNGFIYSPPRATTNWGSGMIDCRTMSGAAANMTKWSIRLLACGLALASVDVLAEGSRTLFPASYPAGGFRADLDLTLDSAPTAPYAGVTARRQFIYVYAKAGEYILLGSSNRANGGDILVFDPQSFGAKGSE
ncbi:MAG TPA: hypothetical protein VFB32_02530, partial [Rudaea sp.]|nr:hypothetical protein [Rudaea sp.]